MKTIQFTGADYEIDNLNPLKMEIEVRELMSENEMLSHIFLGCIKAKELRLIRDKFIAGKDWQNESVKIPVEMKIGGVSVNPKEFFDEWKNQMQGLILERAKNLVAEKLSDKVFEIQSQLNQYEEILKSWESEINWEVDNPLN